MEKSIFINNDWHQGEGEVLESICPLTQDILWQDNQASKEQVTQAMSAANKAFVNWSAISLDKRIKYIESYKLLLERQLESLALLISKEVGKPLWEAKIEISGMINKISISINSYHQRTGTTSSVQASMTTTLTHRPHGVFVILGPYNFPGHLPNGHIIPALLAGNTVVFKPSELTPMVANAMIKLWQEAKLPDGVINLIQGDGAIGQELLNSKPNGVLFTGSYQTGKKIHAHFAGKVEVILALEMGGNNPLIISEVKDLDAAVFTTIMSAFITSGQRCTCVRRLLVPDSKWGEIFLNTLVEHTKLLKVGHYNSPDEPFMGPVINIKTANNLLEKQAAWLANGANALLEMQAGQGAIVTPGIIDVSNLKTLMEDDEIFGPLLQVIRYQDFEQAVEIANDTQYGLAAGLISDDFDQQQYFYNKARAGIVNINKQLTGASGSAPFGGIGHSGNHRASAFYAADFCAFPMASMTAKSVELPKKKPAGMK